MFFFHIIELRISNNFSISISISIFTNAMPEFFIVIPGQV